MALAIVSTRLSAAGLVGIAALHVNWANGSPWPFPDQESLADSVVGRSGGTVPGPAACLAVAGFLTAAAGFVAGRPRGHPALSRLGAAGVVSVLGLRGGLGLAGRTDLVSPGSVSAEFRERDRRLYSPLALTLAGLALPAVR